jgi:hypothetical protein
MKKLIAAGMLAGALSVCAMAQEWTGYIIDQACSSKKEMQGDEACAARCIKRGSPAVLVTADGKVYKIANQDKAIPHAGQKVTVTGKMENEAITIEDIKM